MPKPNLIQKRLLARLLKDTGGSSEVDYAFVDAVLGEIEKVYKAIPSPIDISPLHRDIRIVSKSISEHTSSILVLGSDLAKLKKDLLDVDGGKEKHKRVLEKRIDDIHGEIKKEIESIRRDYKTLLSRPHGGGSMPRQISLGGIVTATRYADINWIGSGVTFSAANNDTYKRTDITVTASGAGLARITLTGTVDGKHNIFTSTVLPTWVISDGGWYEQNDYNSNPLWSYTGSAGAYTITTTFYPNSSIWGF